jgi:hypothetical protein
VRDMQIVHSLLTGLQSFCSWKQQAVVALQLYPYPCLNVCRPEDNFAKISTQELGQGSSSLNKR